MFSKYFRVFIICVACFAFFSRVWRLHIPERYIFDEVYHAVTAKLIAQNDPRAFEWWNPPPEPDTAVDWLHPPVAKYTQAISIRAFGANSFGWRVSSAVAGVGVIVLIAIIGSKLFPGEQGKKIGILAAILASLDGLLLVQSRIAMNDIHVTFAILLSFLLFIEYTKQPKKTALSTILLGIAIGAAWATKWTGIFFSCFVLAAEGIPLARRFVHERMLTPFIQNAVRMLLLAIGVPLIVYIVSYSVMFLQGKNLQHLAEMHRQTWWYQTNLDATHPYQSQPHQWFFSIRPIWYSVDETDLTRSDIYAFQNPGLTLVYSGALAVFLIHIAILLQKKVSGKKVKHLHTYSLLLLVFSIVWVPWVISPRILFYYHFTPAVPFLALIASVVLLNIMPRKYQVAATTASVTFAALGFVAWFPHWTHLPVPRWLKHDLYFMFDSWK